jgi:hypothetical protein
MRTAHYKNQSPNLKNKKKKRAVLASPFSLLGSCSRSAFGSTFAVQRSAFGVRRSAFVVRRHPEPGPEAEPEPEPNQNLNPNEQREVRSVNGTHSISPSVRVL